MSSGPAVRVAAALAVPVLASCSGPLDLPRPSFAAPPSARVPVAQGEASAVVCGDLVSAYRRRHGLNEVVVDPTLQRAAQAQADAMASANQLSHTVAGPLPARLAAVHARGSASVENVSAGYADLRAALGGWRRSPAHDANLLYGPMHRIGVAAASAPGTRYKTFWALVMTN